MRHDVAYADGALSAWASWARSHQGAWPCRTLLGRIMEQGVSGAGQMSEVQTMPDSVAQTDRAVAHLECELQHTLKVYYLTYAPSEEKAARCDCSRATFWRRIERAQIKVYRYLLTSETVEAKFPIALQMSSA